MGEALIPDLNIGKNIVELRKHFKLSQDEFALKAGISKATVSLWENNKKYPSRKNIEKLALIFGIDPKDIFGKDLAKALAVQSQFKFKPVILSIKPGVELHIETEKLSKEELAYVEKAIKLLKVFFSQN